MASSSFIHSSPTSRPRSCKYDIFLSFRGADTRKTFIDHLYSSLEHHLIVTYKDDVTLPRGESIRPSLFEAIEESYIALIIFSKNYVDSSWCLDELAHIMKCKEERGLIVMPIFYDVDPSDIRKQKRDFGTAFAQKEVDNVKKSQVWRNALVEASNIGGWELKCIANGHEAEVIKKIIDTILDQLCHLNTHVEEDLIGMMTRLQELKSLLNIRSNGVRMVGIWGIGGSGKTTLATSLYTDVSKHFQTMCIIENVREETRKLGLKKLQGSILLSLFKKEVHVPSVKEGKDMIKRMACRRKVLLLLDDVDALDQLESLAGKHNWFGCGSRIIITTRDAHLLRTHKVDEVCPVRLLSDDEALSLFNKHAYNENALIEDYKILSLRVVSYAAGLPLALKILGSFLYDKEKIEWMSALDRLEVIPEMEITGKLKISYDGLKTVEKELFLDLACFFRKWEKHTTMDKLEACGFYPQIGIEVLRQKALITIRHGRFDMHDLVQEMGHYIVRGKHPKSPQMHSRVWKENEIESICYENTTMENDMIEAIRYLRWRSCPEHIPSQLCRFISRMKKLRYLDVGMLDHVNYKGPDFLSNELRYIDWGGYGRSPFPDAFQPMNLVFLILYGSRQKHLWKGYKHLPCLKVLKLESMDNLVSTPDFDGLPRLQKLVLYDCGELRKIHPSLGTHTGVEYISVSNCCELRTFPTIVNMKNLKTLVIKDCGKILEFPEIQADMKSLENLSLCQLGIEVLPSSIEEHCTNICSLKLNSLRNLKRIQFNFNAFKHLKHLKLDKLQCFKGVEIPNRIAVLSNLEELSLRGSDISRLGFSLTQFTQLKHLNLSECRDLLEFPKLPSRLTILIATDCTSVVTLGDCFKNCNGLCEVSLVGGNILSDGERLLESMLQTCMAIENHCMLLSLEGVQVARGFTPCLRKGRICRLELPGNWCNDFSGFLMCAVFKANWLVDFLLISMKEIVSSGVDSEDDVRWEESYSSDDDDDDNGFDFEEDFRHRTVVGYVSFASLRETTWWNPTCKTLQFSIDYEERSGLGVRLIERTSRRGLSETFTICSSKYAPKVRVEDDSESALTICLHGQSMHSSESAE